jgi:putative Holliday junction resolvase
MGATLGIDLGSRRIGVAVAATGERARPHVTLRRGRSVTDDAAALDRLCRELAVDAIVVGLPLDVSGGEGEQARQTRAWTETIAPLLGRPMSLHDERFTSHLAEERLGPMPRGRSGGPPTSTQRDRYRARVDREAAAIILQDALDARAGQAARPRHDSLETGS